MSLRKLDIFSDLTAGFESGVNPYRDLLAAAHDLPLVSGPALREKRGSWRRFIAQHHPDFQIETAPLLLEIGCHNGGTLRELARTVPHGACLGIDMTFKRAVKTAQKAVESQLPNMWSILGNAAQLPQLFSPGELDGIVAFFPDPWNQKRHQKKNRLFSASFCQALYQMLRAGGFFWVKTDDEEYHGEIVAAAQAFGGKPSLVPTPFMEKKQQYISTFERKFLAQKLPIYESFWVKLP